MKSDLKEVQAIIGELIQYSCVDEAFADMGLERIDGRLVDNGIGEERRQVLIDFVNEKY